jgi:hypothetical protein
MLRTRPLAVVIGVLVLGIASAAITAATLRADTAITCTNPASGTSWQIKVDYDHNTVDSNPATINSSQISWHDADDGGNYTLDRKSGKLTVIVASATGGYFLYDQCGLQN